MLNNLEGKVFDNGLYKVLDKKSSIDALVRLQKLGISSAINLNPVIFGLDWLGRYYAYDVNDSSYTTLFDIVEAATWKAEGTVDFFHNTILTENNRDLLDYTLFLEWHKKSPTPIFFDKCVSLKLPFFFGGEYEVNNMELSDIDVVWSFNVGLSGGFEG